METKHTPGPWEVDVYGDVIANGEDVAHVVGHYGEEENSANARLIAAAPDLLAALQGIDARGMTQATWARAARAIAKAITPAAQESEP